MGVFGEGATKTLEDLHEHLGEFAELVEGVTDAHAGVVDAEQDEHAEAGAGGAVEAFGGDERNGGALDPLIVVGVAGTAGHAAGDGSGKLLIGLEIGRVGVGEAERGVAVGGHGWGRSLGQEGEQERGTERELTHGERVTHARVRK